ncbi:hypothetical protein [Bathymodiolus platifrons methanotrophic gill symbiont]|uniref:hypothetical protein n=1 Tax=Bathymodiolus platifrons methanotrophic gill symbiont TaxID=113268 RepID=UPI001C8EA9CB|nr:hypothetical protein [Bathymodiolus platifrons methanotrophic gill symbiont]
MKQVKGRWACLFLDFRFYLPFKTIQGKKETATIRGVVVPFQTKMAQAAQMLIEIAEHFSTVPLLAVMIAGLAIMAYGSAYKSYREPV